MHKDHAFLVQALGERGAHIVLAEILHQRVFRQNRERREFRDHVTQDR